jgi:hypothetical protein
MLVIGLVISIIYTAIRFYIWGDNYTATLYLVLGLVGNGKFLLQLQKIRLKLTYYFSAIFFYLWLVVFSYYQLLREEGGHGFYAKTRY